MHNNNNNSNNNSQQQSIAYFWAPTKDPQQQQEKQERSNENNTAYQSKYCRTCNDSNIDTLPIYRKLTGNIDGVDVVFRVNNNRNNIDAKKKNSASVSHRVNSANNKLNLIINRNKVSSKHHSLPAATNLLNKLPTSSADRHLKPTAVARFVRRRLCRHRRVSTASPSLPLLHGRSRRRAASHSTDVAPPPPPSPPTLPPSQPTAFASPAASMFLPYQINQRATLLQASTATSTALPHVQGATITATTTATTTTTTLNHNTQLHAAHRIFNLPGKVVDILKQQPKVQAATKSKKKQQK
ncbi:rhoGEF domain-containing protein gxcJ [Drosophila albomicans]|uniref:RhoGEF domain-containing protein gxcJ n=1 Tax=Drosophila albomicans TaxID=7291 RepID=A0A9C6STC1_DROAB|nr:rhoGEF domain-containing protein gxcJ [Drosophila albomicans]